MGWFEREFPGGATDAQRLGWPPIRAGKHTLIAAPTGSGKTLAAFLWSIEELVRARLDGGLRDETRVVYVSPLKALANDVAKNLERPLSGIRDDLARSGRPDPGIRVAVRSGDTPPAARAAMSKRPPHLLVTTPESLYILLTSDSGRRMLQTARTVIVDEIHAIAGSKRGAHLSLSLERLDHLCGDRLQRIGLSATQRPVERVARFLTGEGARGPRPCEIVDVGHRREMDLGIEVTQTPLSAVLSHEAWAEVYERLAELSRGHATTLVFVNTRRLAERVARHLAERLGEGAVAAHHGSLSRERRLDAEDRLKRGALRVMVATASLELGIDIGDVDLVCQIGTPRSISTLVQRIGRAGHGVGRVPRGRLFPLTRDELVEVAALLDAFHRGELDRLRVPDGPLDILAQQIAAETSAAEWDENELFARFRRADPYRGLSRADFDSVVSMACEGFATSRGRRGALVHRDAVHGKLRARRGTRLLAVTSGGAIPDNADYRVVQEPAGTFVGTVNEDFAIESIAGDIFQLGATSWRIRKVEPGTVRVEDARGQPPTIPFWLGEAPARTDEASHAVSRLREELLPLLPEDASAPDAAIGRLRGIPGMTADAARQIAEYLHAGKLALTTLPTQNTLVTERFFDESGGMQLVVHAPLGSRINRALGLALRKRFCQSFNFELQAAATDDAIVLSLGPMHSFPLADVFSFVRSQTAQDVLEQALLDAPLFPARWRWNATAALAVPRSRGATKVPPRLQRILADDLLAAVFPDSLACFENITAGRREIPDHPLVRQTMRDCTEEAMDLPGLTTLLSRIERGEVRLVARDLPEPSPLAQEVLNAKPYAFLDDAPLEERRTQAVLSRRWISAQDAMALGSLDPAAIARVREEAFPEAVSEDEMHDALQVSGFLSDAELRAEWAGLLAELARAGRAAVATTQSGARLWCAAERLALLRAAVPVASVSPAIAPPPREERVPDDGVEALAEILRARLGFLGPVTASELAASAGIPAGRIEAALARLETEGTILRGRFTADAGGTEWCERRLLARVHRYTLDRLRAEIEPVPAADFMRFLFRWQRAADGARVSGADSLASVVEQLEAFEAPAEAWETAILPARLDPYDPAALDALCLSGRIAWARLSAPSAGSGRAPGTMRNTPIAFFAREHLQIWRPAAEGGASLSSDACAVRDLLAARGASFFAELARGTGILRAQVVSALSELAASGTAVSDSFSGLRALLPDPRGRRARKEPPGRGYARIEGAGRWSLLSAPQPAQPAAPQAADRAAAVLLRRYGVVFRTLLERERLAPPWGELLRIYRRMEARGEARGGRFVSGFTGEQYALPEAVASLRETRRRPAPGETTCVSAADPLNLTAIVTPGERIPAVSANRILFRDGIPVAVQEGGRIRAMGPDAPPESVLRQGFLARPSRRPGRPAFRTQSAIAARISPADA